MHHIVQFEIAMRKLPLLAKAASASTPTSSTTSSSLPTSSTTSPLASSPTSVPAGTADRLQLGSWTGADFPTAEDADFDDTTKMREAVQSKVQQCLDNALATSTITSYEAALRAIIPGAESALGKIFLPLRDENSMFELFGYMQVRDADAPHWTRVRMLRAAIIKWHAIRGEACVIDCWTERMRAFWTGL